MLKGLGNACVCICARLCVGFCKCLWFLPGVWLQRLLSLTFQLEVPPPPLGSKDAQVPGGLAKKKGTGAAIQKSCHMW